MSVNALHQQSPKPVTRATATVFHRAGAWQQVEIAQRLLNDAVVARLTAGPDEHPALRAAYTQLERARAAFVLRVPLASTTGPLARTFTDAQAGVNAAVRAARQCSPELQALDQALAWYVSIGGAEDRRPCDGGLS